MKNFNIFLSSKDADQKNNGTYNSSVRFNLKNSIDIDADQEQLEIKLNHFNAPNVFYNIENDTLQINNYIYNLQDGIYDIGDLIVYLNTLNSDYVFSYNDITRKVSLQTTDTFINITNQNQSITINNRQHNITPAKYTKTTLLQYLNGLVPSLFNNGLQDILAFTFFNNNLQINSTTQAENRYFNNETIDVLRKTDGTVLSTASLTGWKTYEQIRGAISTAISSIFIMVEGSPLNSAMSYNSFNQRYELLITNPSQVSEIFFQNIEFLGFKTQIKNVVFDILGNEVDYYEAGERAWYFDIIWEATNDLSVKSIQSSDGYASALTIDLYTAFTKFSGSVVQYLGFDLENNDVSSLTYTSPYVYNLNINSHLLIKSNFNVDNISSYNKKRGEVLGYIPLGVFNDIAYQNFSNAFVEIDDKNISYIDIDIVDNNNELVNFQNKGWSLSLELNVIKI